MYTIYAVYYMFVDLSIYLLYTKPSATKKMNYLPIPGQFFDFFVRESSIMMRIDDR